MIHPGILPEFSRIFPRDVHEFYKVLFGILPEMSSKYPECFPDSSWKCAEQFLKLSRKCPRNFMECPTAPPYDKKGSNFAQGLEIS